MKLGKAQLVLAALTAAFAVFTLGFFIGRGSAQTTISTQTQVAAEPAAPQALPEPEADRLNLNTATQAELETLPGIGAVLAERILLWREKNGSFISIEQLLDVEGIGAEKYNNIKELIFVEDKV